MALAPSGPSEERAEPDVSLLLRVTGFGTTGAEIETATRARVRGDRRRPCCTPAPTRARPRPRHRTCPASRPGHRRRATRTRAGRTRSSCGSRSAALTLWWLDRMVRVRHPLPERLTFPGTGTGPPRSKVAPGADAAAERDVARARPRRLRALARAMLRDPALLVWLDGQQNTARAPNENLARELMELFTLGRRPLLGERRAGGRPRADRLAGRPARDTAAIGRGTTTTASKTILGMTGELDADGLAELLARPAGRRGVRGHPPLVPAGSPTPPAGDLRRLVAAYGRAGTSTALCGRCPDPAFGRPPVAGQAAGRVASSARSGPLGVAARRAGPAKRCRVLQRPRPGAVLPAQRRRLAVRARLAVDRAATGAVKLAAALAGAGRPRVRRTAADRPDAAAYLLGVGAWSDRTRAVLGRGRGPRAGWYPAAGQPRNLA